MSDILKTYEEYKSLTEKEKNAIEKIIDDLVLRKKIVIHKKNGRPKKIIEVPMNEHGEYSCEICDYQTTITTRFSNHLKTKAHEYKTMKAELDKLKGKH